MIATESQSVLKICRLRPAIRARICTNRDALPLIFAVDNLEAARAGGRECYLIKRKNQCLTWTNLGTSC